MLKHLITAVICLGITVSSFAQPKFRNDRGFKYQSDTLLLNAGIGHPNFDSINFELRFWIRGLGNSSRTLYILQCSPKNAWTMKYYNICVTDDKYTILSKTDSLLNNWERQWRQLLRDNILSLPGEKAGRKNWRSSTNQITVVADGAVYVVELLTKKAKRSYSYSNPDTMVETYDTNNRDLVSINKVISTFTMLFKFPYTGACTN